MPPAVPLSVLSHLTTRFATHPENIATEALSFILGRSQHARQAVSVLVRALGGSTATDAGDLAFEAQCTDDSGARPDLVGKTPDQVARLLVEVKFWAGLTDNQPVGYLTSALAVDVAGCLLFVAPAERVETLWPELLRRVNAAGWAPSGAIDLGARGRSVVVGRHVMALVSWRALLATMQDAVATANDTSTSEDLRQLDALCERMDTTAFLPLHADELTSNLGRRVVQFGALVDDLTAMLVSCGLGDVKRLRMVGGLGYYGRYLRLKGHAAFVQFDAQAWATFGDSPLWLGIKGADWKESPLVVNALTVAGIAFRRDKDWCLLPLYLKTGVEREAVVADAVAQLQAVADALPSVVPTADIPVDAATS